MIKTLSTIFFLFSMSFYAFSADVTIQKADKISTLRGYTRSIEKAVITSEVSGKITAIHYNIGDITHKKPLIQIDTTFINLDIENIGLGLAKIKTQIQKMDSRVSFLKKELDRKEGLYSKGRIPEVTFDAAKQEYDQAILEKQSLLLEQKSLKVQYQQLIEKRKRYAITVPSGWTVTAKHVEKNEVVQPGKPIMQINNFKSIMVPIAVSNEELTSIQKNSSHLKGTLNNQNVDVIIKQVNPEFNEKTRKTDIEIAIINYNGPKRGGMLFKLPISVAVNGLKISEKAVEYRYSNPKVYLVKNNTPVTVTILDTFNGFVIVADIPQLRQGDKLKVIKE